VRDLDRSVVGPEHPDTAACTLLLAKIAALTGRREEALSQLRDAVDHGLSASTGQRLEEEPDLRSLRGDPRFKEIVARAAEKPN
jgi:hypothetical protein